MYKIAICDDEPAICNMIQNVIIDHYEKTDKKIETSVFYSGEKLIESLNKGHTCDLLFLDIELYKISGLVVGEKIRKEYNLESMHIVFISGKTKYHHEVFKIRPLDFIDKPIDKKEVIECINYAMKLDGKTTGTFTFKYNREIYKIPVENIIYIESINKTLHIYCIDGVRKMYGTLKEVAKKLSKYNFVKTHRSYIVNIKMVEVFKSDNLLMSDGSSIPISRTQKYKIHETQNQLQGRI